MARLSEEYKDMSYLKGKSFDDRIVDLVVKELVPRTTTIVYEKSADVDDKVDKDTITNGNKVGLPADPSIGRESTLAWNGTGIFDAFIYALGKNIEIQYDEGRISGEEFATAYVKVLEICLSQSIELVKTYRSLKMQDEMNRAQIALQDAKEKADEHTTAANVQLLKRQIVGFGDNLQLKLAQAQMEGYTMMFSSGMLDDIPQSPLNATALDWEYKNLTAVRDRVRVE